MRSRLPIAFIICSLLLHGCSWFGDEKHRTENWDAARLYQEAKSRLDKQYYDSAVTYYEFLQQRFPFDILAQQGQLELAYCYYKLNESASATSMLERFIKLNPTHENVPYALYLKGVVNFNLGKGFTDRFAPRDPSQRDPGVATKSFEDFSELLRRFPDSIYADDARLRMAFLRNILAQHEINVANYYMRRSAFLAAANRARYVVENYQQAPVMPEALTIMAKAYKILALDDLSADALRVLELNFPQYPGISEVRRTVVR